MTGPENGSMPPETPPEPFFQRPNKRSRVVVACLRCKTRRQKCDNKLPACSNCARAKLNCVFPENEYPTSYVKALQTRVAWLEAQLDSSQTTRPGGHLSIGDSNDAAATSSEGRMASPPSTPNLASSVGLLSLQAAAEPQYFGVSSGVSLALMIESAVYEKARPLSSLSLPAETVESPFASSSRGAIPTATAPLLPVEKATSFLAAYLSYIHPNFPFLSKRQLWKAHHSRHEMENSNSNEARHDHVVLLLVCAIGARCLKLVGSDQVAESEPESLYHSAMAKLQDQLNVPSVQNIQVILLVAIYALRSPSGSSIWHLCGLMIRQCIELGLHRQLRKDDNTAHSDEFKRRLFWSIYHLERRIVLVLGRPLTIADDEIDNPLPSEIEDDHFQDAAELPGISRDHSALDPNSQPRRCSAGARTDILFHVHNIRLDQINAKTRLAFSRLAKSGRGIKVEQKIAKRFQELEDWKTAMFGHSVGGDASADLMSSTFRTPVQTPVSRPALPEAQRLALLLNYHRARRVFLQTILTEIQLLNRPFPYASFAKSSGEVCQLNRRLHRIRSVPFTLLDLHSVFVAGFSMIYCAWSDPSLYDAEMAADLGACSTVLYLIAEQWGEGAKKYRDAFELIAGKTAEYVLSPRRPQTSSHQQSVPVSVHPLARESVAPSDTALSGTMPPHPTSHDIDRSGSDGWTKDSFDVWQMMTEFVQTQDSDYECDPVNFREIEAFLTEEGLGWFNGGTGTSF
ncbi:hypothetical protein AYL99_03254 [Fonsecaea erecta]|uniref:Zn(2)-C6 fungal-type domain-containing protein n=1 Tax=Fonsecaea erecta TaxID=1367422 RepID=A0A178ZWA9_9EURO|nr:hypothetical protein AYL99_03254 [Fonsecaea erecta]OAP64027.1 hypothetical protein AYL99_03254 [Fonsecaea erecta]